MGSRWPGSPTPATRRIRAATDPPLPARPATGRATRPAPAESTPVGGERPPAPPEQPPATERDIRSRRPPVLSFLLKMSTMRRLARIVSLLALDFLAVALAIFTALVLKEAVH